MDRAALGGKLIALKTWSGEEYDRIVAPEQITRQMPLIGVLSCELCHQDTNIYLFSLEPCAEAKRERTCSPKVPSSRSW